MGGNFMEISAIILAAGYSKRMGKDKLLLKYKGKTIIQWIIEAIKEYHFSEIILVTRQREVVQIGEKLNLKIIINNEAFKGQSESVRLGVQNALIDNNLMFFVGDQPLINIDIIRTLVDEFRNSSEKIIAPTMNGQRKNPVIFPKTFRQSLLQLEGDEGGRAIIKNNIHCLKLIEINNGDRLKDIDNIEDYRELLEE